MVKRNRAGGAPIPTIQASVFKATCLELMDDLAARGAEVIVTKHGRPIVKVGPVSDEPASPFGFMRGTVIRSGDVIGPELDQWDESTTDPLNNAPPSRSPRRRE